MSDKHKRRDSASKKLLGLLPGSDYSDSLEEERPSGSRKVANEEIVALRQSIEQMRLQQEHLVRVCTSITVQQTNLARVVHQHLEYERQADERLAQEDTVCCGLSMTRLF